MIYIAFTLILALAVFVVCIVADDTDDTAKLLHFLRIIHPLLIALALGMVLTFKPTPEVVEVPKTEMMKVQVIDTVFFNYVEDMENGEEEE